MKIYCAITLGVIAWALNVAFAQKYNVKTYTVNDGLPSSQIYDLELDAYGYAWFATAYGLVRYDGYEFVTYGENEGLNDEYIYDIYIDSNHQMWVSTDKGGVGVMVDDSIRYSSNFTSLDTTLINIITQSGDGSMWFGTYEDGLFIWDNFNLTKLTKADGLPHNRIWDIKFYNEDEVWITTEAGIAIYKEGEGVIDTWTKKDGLSGAITYQTFEAIDGTIWVSTSNGISLLKDGEVRTITEVDGKDLGYVYNINQGDDGVIWIGTERKGLYWYEPNLNNFTHITKRNGLSSNYIYRIVKDPDGNIWVATDGNGVTLFKDRRFHFYDISTDVGTNSVTALYQDEDGAIWYGSDKGLGRYKNEKFDTYKIPEEIFEEGNTIWDIEKLPNGNLILLTYTYWLIEYDGEKFFRSPINNPLMNYYITDVLVRGDEVLIATGSGLATYKEDKIDLVQLHKDYWKNSISILFEDADGILWVGTSDGIAKENGDTFTFYTEKDGVKGSSINEIAQDQRGNIWVGTNEGISALAPSPSESNAMYVSNIYMQDMYMPETISLLFDNQGGLWQGTNGGLNYFDVEKWYGKNIMDELHYSLNEYGNGLEFNGASSLLDKNGDLWFGSEGKGLVKYEMSKHTGMIAGRAPVTHIRKIYADNELIYEQNKNYSSFMDVVLPYNKNNLKFEFGGINYKNPDRLEYQYKLEGFDEDWSKRGPNREALYTNLDPGNYHFKVISKAPRTSWGEAAISFNITIDQPFWQKWWFILFIIGTVIALIVQYVGAYINFIEKKKLKDLVEEQTHYLKVAVEEREVLIKEIHHRVKNNMAVVSGMLQLQSDRMDEGDAKNAIENSKLRIQSMSSIHEKLYQNEDLAHVNIQDFVNDLIDSISTSLRGVNQNIKVEHEIEVKELDLNKAVPCGLLLNELICNSFEHAFPENQDGTVRVVFKENNGNYILSVADDGIGIPDHIIDEERSSLGLTLIQSLTHQIEGKLEFRNGKGTTIWITFPR